MDPGREESDDARRIPPHDRTHALQHRSPSVSRSQSHAPTCASSESTSNQCEPNAAKGGLKQAETLFERTSLDCNLPFASFSSAQSSPSPLRSPNPHALPFAPYVTRRQQTKTDMGAAAPRGPTRQHTPAPPPPANVPNLLEEARMAEHRTAPSPVTPVRLQAVATPTDTPFPRHAISRADTMPPAHDKEKHRVTPPIRPSPATQSPSPQHATAAIQAQLPADMSKTALGLMSQDLLLALFAPPRQRTPGKEETVSVNLPQSTHRMSLPTPQVSPLLSRCPEGRAQPLAIPLSHPRADVHPPSQPMSKTHANSECALKPWTAVAPCTEERHSGTYAHTLKPERTFVARAIQTEAEDVYHPCGDSPAPADEATTSSRPFAGGDANNAKPPTVDNLVMALHRVDAPSASPALNHGTATSLGAFFRGLHHYTEDHGNNEHQALRFIKGFKESLHLGLLGIAGPEDRELFLEVLREICLLIGNTLIEEGGIPWLFDTPDRKQPTNAITDETSPTLQPSVTSATTVGPTPLAPSGRILLTPNTIQVSVTPPESVPIAAAPSLKKASGSSPKNTKKRKRAPSNKADSNENQAAYNFPPTAPAPVASPPRTALLAAASNSGVQPASSDIGASVKSPKRKSKE